MVEKQNLHPLLIPLKSSSEPIKIDCDYDILKTIEYDKLGGKSDG